MFNIFFDKIYKDQLIKNINLQYQDKNKITKVSLQKIPFNNLINNFIQRIWRKEAIFDFL